MWHALLLRHVAVLSICTATGGVPWRPVVVGQCGVAWLRSLRACGRPLAIAAWVDRAAGGSRVRWGPLQLFDRGWWVPGDEYWGEPHDAVPVPLVEVVAGGARRSFELEQLLPGGDDPDPRDPIEEAIALRDAGQALRAEALLQDLVEWDARCLDAHAHLGVEAFNRGDLASAVSRK